MKESSSQSTSKSIGEVDPNAIILSITNNPGYTIYDMALDVCGECGGCDSNDGCTEDAPIEG